MFEKHDVIHKIMTKLAVNMKGHQHFAPALNSWPVDALKKLTNSYQDYVDKNKELKIYSVHAGFYMWAKYTFKKGRVDQEIINSLGGNILTGWYVLDEAHILMPYLIAEAALVDPAKAKQGEVNQESLRLIYDEIEKLIKKKLEHDDYYSKGHEWLVVPATNATNDRAYVLCEQKARQELEDRKFVEEVFHLV